ncbi:hypothetical protein GCM10027053_15270 [Intrasporangium mesophilum]
MSQPVNERVLVVDHDTRVRAALAALIDATPGLQVAATTRSTDDAVAVGRLVGATIAIVDVDTGRTADNLAVVRELAQHLAVIAVGNGAHGRRRALDAGAIAVCDKNGDSDALTAAVVAAARHRPPRAGTTEDVGSATRLRSDPNPQHEEEK